MYRESIDKDELAELTLQDSLKNMENDWNCLRDVIKAECKKAGYKWQYTDRLMEHFTNRNLSAGDVAGRLKMIMASGKKISGLMYI